MTTGCVCGTCRDCREWAKVRAEHDAAKGEGWSE